MRHSPGGSLPHRLLKHSSILAVLLSTSAFTVSCTMLEGLLGIEKTERSAVSFYPTGGCRVDSIDLFIYRDEAVRTLELHARLPYLDSAGIHTDTLELSRGSKVAVAAANLPGHPDIGKLSSYESVELLTIDYENDNTERPVMSGISVFQAGGNCEVELRPLLCTIVLSEVSNNLTGYTCLENPRCYLENVNESAELFRETGFRPSGFLDRTEKVSLPCDVGLLAQYPDSHLHCYPNDSQEGTVGTPRTCFTFECEIKGETCSFSTELPSLSRASTHTVELTVNSKTDFRYKVY